MTDNRKDTGHEAASWLSWALLGVVVGTACQLQQARLSADVVYAALAATALAVWVIASRSRQFRRAGWLLAAAGLAFSFVGLRSIVFERQALSPALEGRDIALTGMVAAMPQRNEGGLRFRFELESAQTGGQRVQLPPQLYLGWYGGFGAEEAQRQPQELRAGERWQFTVRLKAPHGNLNPYGFDYELWLWEQGLQATGYVRAGRKDPPPQRVGETWRHPVESARQAVRERIYARVENRKAAGLLAALVVGDQNAIDRADWDVFRATGVAHLMSISGLHITMFAWVAALAVGWFWQRSRRLCLAFPSQHAALLGGIALATGYAVFSGWGVPAQRTICMLVTVGVLRLSGRRWPWPQVWLAACAVVVTIDPWALLQAGFWLSFVAVGVLFASDAGSQAQAQARPGVAGRLRGYFHEQGVVTLALLPLTVLLFGQVSTVGLLANAVAIPWITLLVTPLAMAGVVLAPFWDVAAWALLALGGWLEWLASWRWATLSTAAPPLWAAAAGCVGGVLMVMRLPLPIRALGLPLLFPVLLWQAPRPAAGEFELLAADIGQGNAVIVRTSAHTLVYDSGPRYSLESDAGHRVLVPLLRALGERVDTLMLSHRDLDHTGGAVAVLGMQPAAALVSSIEDSHELQEVRKATRCVAGQRWRWDGVDFELLHPDASDYDAAVKSNAMSCVLRVSNGRQSALLPGDIEQAQEMRLLTKAAGAPPDAVNLRADVLLVPHHGHNL